MTQHLPHDATIAKVLQTLGDADAYVANVRHKMDKAQKVSGAPVTVRIGIRGNGTYPAYKIEGDMKSQAFGGQFHRPFSDVELTEVNWSEGVMTFAEVTDLLMTLRPAKDITRSDATVKK